MLSKTRQIPLYVRSKNKTKKKNKWKNKVIDTENRLVAGTRGRGWEVGEMDEGSQNVQTSCYKINSYKINS